jgi:hypothetical protein
MGQFLYWNIVSGKLTLHTHSAFTLEPPRPMTRIKTACAALVIPFFLASCVTDRTQESAESMATMEASTEEMTEELDPNDPNVMVCPVTGQMQRIDDADAGEGPHRGDADVDF